MPGSQGRQVVNKSGKLVWVHTLCGMYHGVHTGMVYGCDEYGQYDDSNMEDTGTLEDTKKEEDDTQKLAANIKEEVKTKEKEEGHTKKTNNSIIGSKVIEFEFAAPPPVIVDEPPDVESKPSLEEDEEVVSVTATAWFVIGGKETGQWADWARQTRTNIGNARKDVCCFCKHPDNVSGCLRIPVSCSAGSMDEPKTLSCRRKNANDRCATAMHVGCARWALTQKGKHAGKKSKYRRLFFTPGREAGSSNLSDGADDDTKEKQIAKPAVACYCFKHAKEIQEEKGRIKRLEERKRKFACLQEEEESSEAEEEKESSSDGSSSNASSDDSRTSSSGQSSDDDELKKSLVAMGLIKDRSE